MRRSVASGSQAMDRPDVKQLKKLKQENDLLKLLYADLLQKFLAMRDGLTRSAMIC